MKKIFPLLLLAFLIQVPSWAQPTFTEDVAEIIYNNCTVCHRSGEIGPMAFTNYDEVKAWGNMIEFVTEIKYMPPWKPDPAYSTFLGEKTLSDEEINTIKDWVAAGMPEGDPALEPALPTFPTGSQIGTPDLVLSFEQAFTHQGNMEDQYQVMVIPTGLTTDQVVKAIEMRPGNTALVHHALFGTDITGQAQDLDAQTPEYGFEDFGGFGVSPDEVYPAYTPGARPILYPDGLGQIMRAGSDLLVQMHYAPSPIDQTDSSTINIFFADAAEAVDRFIETEIMLPFGGTLTNGPFVLQPEQVKTFHGVFNINEKTSLLGVAPHMHLLGKDWTIYAVQPNGDTLNLVSIPEWDFNWQSYYFFKQFQILEVGAVLHVYGTYDNTSQNPFNPNNPPQQVGWGEGTGDEMFYIPFLFVPYEDGDEDLVFDDPTSANSGLRLPKNKLYPIYPNPGTDRIHVGFELIHTTEIQLLVYDSKGALVEQLMRASSVFPGQHQLEFNLDNYKAGMYFVVLDLGYEQLTQKVRIE